MNSIKEILLSQYDLHDRLFNNVIADISDDESNRVIAPTLNTVKWLAGHLLWNQGALAKIGGAKIKIPWAVYFYSQEGGSDEDRNAPKTALPTLNMIRDKWNEISPTIRTGLENLTDSGLSEPISHLHPIKRYNGTVSGWWAFVNHHRAYTIGQVGALRRGLGKVGMSYE